MPATVERVGYAGPDEVGTVHVDADSCIFITPDGEVEAIVAEGAAERRRQEALDTAERIRTMLEWGHTPRARS